MYQLEVAIVINFVRGGITGAVIGRWFILALCAILAGQIGL
jgi:hypothetical protein